MKVMFGAFVTLWLTTSHYGIITILMEFIMSEDDIQSISIETYGIVNDVYSQKMVC